MLLCVVLGAVGCSSTVTTGGAPTPAPAPVAPTAGAGVPATGVRPNILMIEADDMRSEELRWMPRTTALLGGGLSFAN